jgi:hypothetical protein
MIFLCLTTDLADSEPAVELLSKVFCYHFIIFALASLCIIYFIF